MPTVIFIATRSRFQVSKVNIKTLTFSNSYSVLLEFVINQNVWCRISKLIKTVKTVIQSFLQDCNCHFPCSSSVISLLEIRVHICVYVHSDRD